MLSCVLLFLGTSLDIRQLVIHTMQVRSKWYEFGCALELPLKRLDKLSEKYYDNPVRAFIRVYHYWMSDNNLEVTVDNLLSALHTVNEYMAARNVEAVLQVRNFSHTVVTYIEVREVIYVEYD